MGKMKKFVLIGLASLGVLAIAKAMTVEYNQALVNETGLAYNNNYTLDLNDKKIDNVAVQAVYSSATVASVTFTDGQESTGTVTVTTTTGLGAVAASNNLTIETTTIPSGSVLTINQTQIQLLNYADNTTTATAINVAKAITSLVPGVTASTGGASVVYATATLAGLGGNNMVISANVSTNTVLVNGGTTVSNTSNFSGGQDPGTLSIAGYSISFTVTPGVGGSSTTATSIVNAINSNSNLKSIIVATNNTTGAVVITTSTQIGAFTNYVIASSSDAALTVGGSTKTVTGLNGASLGQMWGGADSAVPFVAGATTTKVINVSNKFTTSLQVLLSTVTGTVQPLANGTTYFAIPLTAGSFELARTSTDAVAGNAIIITSSATKATADSFTVAPLAISGTMGFKWQESIDGSNYFDAAVSSVSLSSPYTAGNTVWDFGQLNYRYLRANVTAPTQGGFNLVVTVNGKKQ